MAALNIFTSFTKSRKRREIAISHKVIQMRMKLFEESLSGLYAINPQDKTLLTIIDIYQEVFGEFSKLLEEF